MGDTRNMEPIRVDLTEASMRFADHRRDELVERIIEHLDIEHDGAAHALNELVVTSFIAGARACAVEYAATLIERGIVNVQLELQTIEPDLDWMRDDDEE